MRREGYRLAGLSGSLQGWTTRRFLVRFLIPIPHLRLLTLSTFFSQCAGSTPQGQDFEAFIGTKKATEFKTLFTTWVHTVYRAPQFHRTLLSSL